MMGTKTFNNYEDLLTFTRASKGHALRPVSYGDEIFGNSGFDDTSEWTLALNSISISNGKLIYDGINNIRGADQQVSVEAGKIYQLSFEVLSGTARLYLGEGYASTNLISDLAAANYGVGKHVVNVVANGSYDEIGFSFSRFSGGTACEIDDFSLKEVTFDESDGTLTLLEHPNNIPRVEYDADGNRLGLLVEESRTNLVPYSEDLSTWNTSVTVTDNNVVSPAKIQNASTLTSTSSGTSYGIDKGGITVAAGNHTLSAYFKANGFNYGKLTWYSAANSTQYAVFNLSTGEVHGGTYDDAGIQDVGNGWYRCHITTSLNATSAGGAYAWMSNGTLSRGSGVTGDGIKGIHAYGVQLEAGSFPTSYIKTTGSTATRSADVASIPVADFGYNQSALTVLIEASHLYDTFPTFNRFWELKGGGDTFGLQGNAGGSSYVAMTVGGTSQISFSNGAEGAADANTFMKYAVGLKTDDFDIARDGSLDTGETSITMPDSINNFNFGKADNGLNQLSGHIKSIKYYPRRLTNAQLQDLTS